MTGTVVARARALLVRGLAVAAVLFTYAIGNVGTQFLTTVGVSSLALTTSVKPADARRWRRRRYRRRRWYRRRWW
ncbi:MAG: hypothetical protein U1E81_14625 [Xanthobacteraceae bacterium]